MKPIAVARSRLVHRAVNQPAERLAGDRASRMARPRAQCRARYSGHLSHDAQSTSGTTPAWTMRGQFIGEFNDQGREVRSVDDRALSARYLSTTTSHKWDR